jgi:hypothetical protein
VAEKSSEVDDNVNKPNPLEEYSAIALMSTKMAFRLPSDRDPISLEVARQLCDHYAYFFT